jgi:hypothetical protein
MKPLLKLLTLDKEESHWNTLSSNAFWNKKPVGANPTPDQVLSFDAPESAPTLAFQHDKPWSWLDCCYSPIRSTGQELAVTPRLGSTSRLTASSLISIGASRYRVKFTTPLGSQTFVFTVNDEVVPVVSWEPEFRAFMGEDFSPVIPLFDAILAFHESQSSLEQKSPMPLAE